MVRYEIGYFIPHDVDKVEGWKEKLEGEILRINEIVEELEVPYVFDSSVEAAGVAQLIKERLGETEAIVQVRVEPRTR